MQGKTNSKLVLAVMLLVTVGVTVTAVWAKKAISLPVHGEVPGFKLTDHNGEVFDSEKMKGRVWVVHFHFTTCKSICPVMNIELKDLMGRFQKNKRYSIASITVNPQYDTQEVLAKYVKDTGSDFENWKFLTGKLEDIEKVANTGLKIAFPDNPMSHSDRFILIGPNMKIRGFYSLNDERHLFLLERDSARLLGGW